MPREPEVRRLKRNTNSSRYPCKYEIGHQDTNAALPPEEFASKLRADANNIREQSSKRPVRSYGIELPEKATISLFGTKLMISIYTLTQVMQIVLFPILILWLGSLFNTRYRETILIGVAAKISDLYPHVINVYMNATLPPLRKKSWAGYYFKTLIPYFPALVRIFLLSIFIMPPTIFYCASLFYLSADEHAALAVMAGFLVIIFSMTNAISELSRWHAGKTFPGPKLNAQR
ncbi:hypothetical protein ACQZ32_25120 [Ralstonia pseudosolanacearum]|uniref:hypothetical protein n=1 Tax=Ralstonia pseudosolanacearum TaxID=1310165 RepID=UPI000B200A5D|nr:hypothetical protein [Ralstonia pseudosolanacearum]MDC6295630.1 hypothetical protein [Ralstonia pseudosolanacearum]MDD7790545.1 hypothetical protein [Ralstonia pseudosolanacearum]MDN3370517.1 hypothetical protein [Ralstonia pseudosolanacearum]QOK85394.1 hypothetical protein HF907_01345 [Ralstonia pseudosolanacearum]